MDDLFFVGTLRPIVLFIMRKRLISHGGSGGKIADVCAEAVSIQTRSDGYRSFFPVSFYSPPYQGGVPAGWGG